jgi:hypothetical protein
MAIIFFWGSVLLLILFLLTAIFKVITCVFDLLEGFFDKMSTFAFSDLMIDFLDPDYREKIGGLIGIALVVMFVVLSILYDYADSLAKRSSEYAIGMLVVSIVIVCVVVRALREFVEDAICAVGSGLAKILVIFCGAFAWLADLFQGMFVKLLKGLQGQIDKC